MGGLLAGSSSCRRRQGAESTNWSPEWLTCRIPVVGGYPNRGPKHHRDHQTTVTIPDPPTASTAMTTSLVLMVRFFHPPAYKSPRESVELRGLAMQCQMKKHLHLALKSAVELGSQGSTVLATGVVKAGTYQLIKLRRPGCNLFMDLLTKNGQVNYSPQRILFGTWWLDSWPQPSTS